MTPRGLRVVALSVVLGGTALLLSGCSWSEALGLGWPEGITPEAHANRELWIGSLIAALVIGVIVWGLLFWTAAFHRHKKSDTELPRQFGYNMPLELVLTVTPFLIISVLFYFTVVVQERMLHNDPNPEVVVDVTAFQWSWKFGTRGSTSPTARSPTTVPTMSARRPWSPGRRAWIRTARNWSERCAG